MAGALLVSELVLRLANPSIPPAVDLGSIPPERTADVSAMPTPTGRDTSGVAPDDDSPSGTGMRDHANERGAYAFSYPAGWNVATDGEVSELRSPDDVVVFSFGPAPAGALSEAATSVAERYSSTAVIEIVSSREDTTDQGLRTWVVGGIGRIPTGPHDRFLAIAVDAPRGNQAIMVRFPSGPAILDLLPEIERVISSYRDTSTQTTA